MTCSQFKSGKIQTSQTSIPQTAFTLVVLPSFMHYSLEVSTVFSFHIFLLFWLHKSVHMPPSVFCPKYYLLDVRDVTLLDTSGVYQPFFILRSGYPRSLDVSGYFCYLCVCLCLALQGSQPLSSPYLCLFVFQPHFPPYCFQKASVVLIHFIFLCQLCRPILNSPVTLSYVLFFVPPLLSDCISLTPCSS